MASLKALKIIRSANSTLKAGVATTVNTAIVPCGEQVAANGVPADLRAA